MAAEFQYVLWDDVSTTAEQFDPDEFLYLLNNLRGTECENSSSSSDDNPTSDDGGHGDNGEIQTKRAEKRKKRQRNLPKSIRFFLVQLREGNYLRIVDNTENGGIVKVVNANALAQEWRNISGKPNVTWEYFR